MGTLPKRKLSYYDDAAEFTPRPGTTGDGLLQKRGLTGSKKHRKVIALYETNQRNTSNSNRNEKSFFS